MSKVGAAFAVMDRARGHDYAEAWLLWHCMFYQSPVFQVFRPGYGGAA